MKLLSKNIVQWIINQQRPNIFPSTFARQIEKKKKIKTSYGEHAIQKENGRGHHWSIIHLTMFFGPKFHFFFQPNEMRNEAKKWLACY